MGLPDNGHKILSLNVSYPYVLIDGVLQCDRTKKMARAYKLTSNSERYFVGHFPDAPTMPGVLMLMAFSQIATIFYQCDSVRLLAVEKIRFQQPIRPGMRLDLYIEELNMIDGVSTLQIIGTTSESVCVKGRLRVVPLRGKHE